MVEKEQAGLPSFRLDGQTAVITGGGGVLGSAMARGLSAAGARVVLVGRTLKKVEQAAAQIRTGGGEALGLQADVTDRDRLAQAREEVAARFGSVDILVNAAGGNQPGALTSADQSFFHLNLEAINTVFGINFTGTLVSCQVFGETMAAQRRGVILNVASMASLRPLTRVVAYSAAKSAVVNFTQWLAVHMAQEYSPAIRVNALAPGFFLTEQNRTLLKDPATGEPTARAKSILAHTPMNRLGDPEDLLGALLWLVSPASSFVTGIVLPVDGGFSAFGGV